MDKNLKGKECGKGISQRRGGWYTARFTNRLGKRKDSLFSAVRQFEAERA